LKASSRNLQQRQVGGGMAAGHVCGQASAVVQQHLHWAFGLTHHVVVGNDATVAIPDDPGADAAAVDPDLDDAWAHLIDDLSDGLGNALT